MKATISNYRGIASAELDLSRICLIGGKNEAGKTSTAQAIAAAFTGEPVPIVGVKKSQAGMLVRSGTATGYVEIVSDKGTRNIAWPGARVKTEGTPPCASPIAVGMVSLATMEDKDRIKFLTDLLNARATREDLEKSLEKLKLPQQTLDQLWKLIETQGWDNAHLQIKEKGARLKGQWEGITGDKYGSRKSAGWIPPGWEPDLDGASEETLSAIVTDTRDAVEGTIAVTAVDEDKLNQLKDLAATKPLRERALAEAEKESVDPEISSQLESLRSQRAEVLGNIDILVKKRDAICITKPESIPCPACAAELQVIGKSIVLANGISEKEMKEREAAHKDIQKKIDAANVSSEEYSASIAEKQEIVRRFETTRSEKIGAARQSLKQATDAEKELATMVDAAPSSEGGNVDEMRALLNHAETRLKAYKTKRDADRIYASIDANQELIDTTGSEGVRADVLSKALGAFNSRIEPITKAAGWRPVAIEKDFSITYGGSPYLLLSESAKFRVRVALQLVLAKMDNSAITIIDAADILDRTGRNGLLGAIHASKLPSVVTMTIDSMDLVPDLGKAGLGVSYWIENASAVEVR